MARKRTRSGSSAGPVGASGATAAAAATAPVTPAVPTSPEQIERVSDQLITSTEQITKSGRAYLEATDRYMSTAAEGVQEQLDMLREYQGDTGVKSKYPALTVGFLLSAVLLVLKIFDVQVSDEDVGTLKNLLELAIIALAPVTGGLFVHTKVTPAPTNLQGLTKKPPASTSR